MPIDIISAIRERIAVEMTLATTKKKLCWLSDQADDVLFAIEFERDNFGDLNHRLGQLNELIEGAE